MGETNIGMTLIQTIAGQLAIIAGAIITAFTILKAYREYLQSQTERLRIKVVHEASDKTTIASLQESIKNLLLEREKLVQGYNKKFEEMEEEMEKLEDMIRNGDTEAAKECQQMRNQMHQFIQDTWKIIMTK